MVWVQSTRHRDIDLMGSRAAKRLGSLKSPHVFAMFFSLMSRQVDAGGEE